MEDDQLSYVMAGRRRQDVLLCLAQEKGTIAGVARRLDVHALLLYNTFAGLVRHNLIAHNNVTRFRIYHITEDGLDVLKYMGIVK